MDDAVRQALARWPDVPDCFGWLSLSRRGEWQLPDGPIRHAGLAAFIGRNYEADASGRWYFQNGPQRVFVSLAYTPWVLRREGDAFVTHNGQPVDTIKAVFLDEEGSLLLETELGIGLLDDRDLPRFLGECRTSTGNTVDDEDFLALLAGERKTPINWQALPLQQLVAVDVQKRFKFEPHPQAPK